MHDLLCFCDVLESVVPVFQEVCLLIIVHSDVQVVKHSREEVVNFPCDVQDVVHSVTKKFSYVTLNPQWFHFQNINIFFITI